MNVPPYLKEWLPRRPAHRIGYLIGVLRNGVQAVVARVLQVALPAADQRAAGGFLVDVGIHDAQVLGYIVAIHRRRVAVVIAVVARCALHSRWLGEKMCV